MSRKERSVEVSVNDVKVNDLSIQEVVIGKNKIGEVKPESDRFIAVMADGMPSVSVRSQEEGLEYIIQMYHLHQG